MINPDKLINEAFIEDKVRQDITADALFSSKIKAKAEILCKQEGVICGLAIVKLTFKKLDKNSHVKVLVKDGQFVKKGKRIALINASARSILSAERTALNFIQHLSGIATLTRKFAYKLKGTKIKLLDTRKTIPGMRELEKYAVRCGGGTNHRLNLKDMALIKDNHLKISNDIKRNVAIIKEKYPKVRVEVECDNIIQVKQAVGSMADIIMLDNMSVGVIKKASKLIRASGNKIEIEVSGGVNLGNIARYAKLDIDRISIGALTHSVPALDISLEII
jgi:nicotinate-nucleotide pyrophosphorylase (carboxylating)